MDIIHINNIYQSLIQIIQNSNLSIGIIYFIIKDIYNEVSLLYQSELNKQIEQQVMKEKSTLDESDS